MKQMILVLFPGMLSSAISAQTDTVKNQKPINIRIYTTDGYIKM